MARFLLNRITLLFAIILVLGLASGLAYQVMYVQPEKACEAAGKWWAKEWRACATPMGLKRMPLPAPPPAAPAPAPKQP